MKKKSLVVLTILGALASLTFSCKTSPTEPERRIKTPREMTWTADTLPVPAGAIQVLPEDLLVLSPTDIWLAVWMGHGQLMHYNGSTWTKVLDSGGINCLAGTTVDDLWAGGYTGNQWGEVFISHYTGGQWNPISTKVKGEILDMTKDPEGNIWACGRNGVILKYDKTKWITDTIKVGHYSDAEYFSQSVAYYNDKAYIIGIVSDFKRMKNVYYYMTGNMHSWTIADSVVSNSPSNEIRWGDWNLNITDFGKLYSVGLEGIWVYSPNGWNQIYKIDSTIYGVAGISESYILAVGDFQQVLFFNGSTWENFVNLFPQIDRSFVCTNVWTNGYETFIAGFTVQGYPQKTIIFHGK